MKKKSFPAHIFTQQWKNSLSNMIYDKGLGSTFLFLIFLKFILIENNLIFYSIHDDITNNV